MNFSIPHLKINETKFIKFKYINHIKLANMNTQITFGIFIITSSVFGATILNTCQNNPTDAKKNIEFQGNRWFQIGQLYAFCMQVCFEKMLLLHFILIF